MSQKSGPGLRFSFAMKGKSKKVVCLKVIGGPPVDPKNRIELNRSEQQYFKDLHKIIDGIFSEAAQLNMTWSKLAEAADVAYATVDNLGVRKTRWPRFMTIYKLAYAVGWELITVEKQQKRKAVASQIAG